MSVLLCLHSNYKWHIFRGAGPCRGEIRDFLPDDWGEFLKGAGINTVGVLTGTACLGLALYATTALAEGTIAGFVEGLHTAGGATPYCWGAIKLLQNGSQRIINSY